MSQNYSVELIVGNLELALPTISQLKFSTLVISLLTPVIMEVHHNYLNFFFFQIMFLLRKLWFAPRHTSNLNVPLLVLEGDTTYICTTIRCHQQNMSLSFHITKKIFTTQGSTINIISIQ